MFPVVRLFIACQSDNPDVLAFAHTVADLALAIQPEPSGRYPLEFADGFCFYAIVTGCRRPHGFQIRQRCGVGPSARLDWESRVVTMALGTDPEQVHAVSFPVRRLAFPTAGQYEFVLVCDGIELDPVFYLEARV